MPQSILIFALRLLRHFEASSLATATVLAAVCGCQGTGDATRAGPGDADAQVERSQVQRGPIRLVVEVTPKLARLSDELTLTLTLDYEQGVKVDKPPFGEALGGFIIRDFREPLPEVREKREIVRQIYTLEPVRTGKLRIQPIPVSFTDDRPKGDGRQHQIESEVLTIDVTTALEEEVPSLADLEGLEGPVELPQRSSAGGWLTAACALVAVFAVAVVVWLVRRGRKPIPKIVHSPQELAYLELQQLLEEGWQERDIKLFYVELTGIVRRYIERTTGVHAPEQTTGEFLREVSEGDVFPSTEQGRLQAFLESADLVKFAAHVPESNDVKQTFERAKIFIGLEGQEAAA